MLCKFPKVLAKLRRQKGISQKQAAEELGNSPALLSHYENGIRECGLDFLLRIADYYSVSCDYLLGKSDIKNPASYEAEAETLAIDRILKTAKSSKEVHKTLCDIANLTAYHMVMALHAAGDSTPKEAKLGDSYKYLCPSLVSKRYSEIGTFDAKKLPQTLGDYEATSLKKAENLIKEFTK